MLKYIKRLAALPFVMALQAIHFFLLWIKTAIYFVRYGGEWITYMEKDKESIHKIYSELTKTETDEQQ